MVDTMRAERFYADSKTIVVEDIPIPEPDSGEVLVKVAFCGICHSDLSLINGTFPAQRPVVTQGHEASGTIARLGIKAGDPVRVSTRRGTVELDVRQDESVPDGVVFIPFAFVEAAANLLTNPALDPFGKIPEFKYCAAKVERIDEAARVAAE